jgi:hypothetical protein
MNYTRLWNYFYIKNHFELILSINKDQWTVATILNKLKIYFVNFRLSHNG